MMKAALCLLMALVLGFSGGADVRLADYMPWIYNFYDVIAQGVCLAQSSNVTMMWALRRSCHGNRTCTQLCTDNGLTCVFSYHIHKNPQILSDSEDRQLAGDSMGLKANIYELNQGCFWPAGSCGPNYCCCEG